MRIQPGVPDLYGPLPFLQHSWAFTCYLLQRFGDSPHSESFYADRFLAAFPAVIERTTPIPYQSPAETAAGSYTLRVLRRFLGFFGLVNYSWTRQPMELPEGVLTLRPLLFEVVQYQAR